jgi:hypothetical protein
MIPEAGASEGYFMLFPFSLKRIKTIYRDLEAYAIFLVSKMDGG